MRETLRQYTYYIIIAVVSLFSLLFLPMLSSEIGVDFAYPETVAGQIVWWTTKAIVSALNVVIFSSFVNQAKINVKDDPNFIEANKILLNIKDKEVHPRSPRKMNLDTYGKKGTTLFITTALSLISLTQAILTFDYVSMLTYLFTITMGIVFGVLTMKKVEIYWTEEYLLYAKKLEKENESNDRI